MPIKVEYTNKLDIVLYLCCIVINRSPYLATWVKIATISMSHQKKFYAVVFQYTIINFYVVIFLCLKP